jgi:hypothetical protein
MTFVNTWSHITESSSTSLISSSEFQFSPSSCHNSKWRVLHPWNSTLGIIHRNLKEINLIIRQKLFFPSQRRDPTTLFSFKPSPFYLHFSCSYFIFPSTSHSIYLWLRNEWCRKINYWNFAFVSLILMV